MTPAYCRQRDRDVDRFALSTEPGDEVRVQLNALDEAIWILISPALPHTTTTPVKLGTGRAGGSVRLVSIYLFVAAAIGSVAATVRALVPVYRDRLRWGFYLHVYDRGGQRDLKAAADALEDTEEDE